MQNKLFKDKYLIRTLKKKQQKNSLRCEYVCFVIFCVSKESINIGQSILSLLTAL